MASTIIPSQLGYTAPGSNLRSQVYIGKDVTVGFEAVGLGDNGRPDALEALKVNISKIEGETTTLVCAFYLDVTDVLEITAQSNYPSSDGANKDELFLKLREVAVCEVDDENVSTEKRMVILGSQTYAAPDE